MTQHEHMRKRELISRLRCIAALSDIGGAGHGNQPGGRYCDRKADANATIKTHRQHRQSHAHAGCACSATRKRLYHTAID
jgi:hypothetical protein